jgi:hypothetical protein
MFLLSFSQIDRNSSLCFGHRNVQFSRAREGNDTASGDAAFRKVTRGQGLETPEGSEPPVQCHTAMKFGGLAGKGDVTTQHRDEQQLGLFSVVIADSPIL